MDLVGGVVDDEIDQHPHPALLRAMGKFDEIAKRAVAPVDAIIVGDVITAVAMRRDLKRHQPNCRDAEPRQVIEPARQPNEVPDPITVRVHVDADGGAINDSIFVPEIVDHAPSPRTPGQT
jgi:hypothetical protein